MRADVLHPTESFWSFLCCVGARGTQRTPVVVLNSYIFLCHQNTHVQTRRVTTCILDVENCKTMNNIHITTTKKNDIFFYYFFFLLLVAIILKNIMGEIKLKKG